MPSVFFNLPFIGSVSFLTALEWLCACLGLLSVIGNLKLMRWGWLAQAASGLGYGFVFYHQSLFGLSLLQVYFVAVALGAWWVWSGETGENATKIRYLSSQQVYLSVIGWAVGTIIVGLALTKAAEGSTAYIDAFTTIGSVLAQWLMLRYFQNTWHVWFVVNIVSVILFFYSNLYPTSLLYGLFALLAIAGAKSWKNKAKAS
jgi:nicotinamide mononucleotide transporter